MAIVTGATAPGRVGLAIALELARQGCDLVLTHRPESPPAHPKRARSQIEALGARAILAPLELSDPASAEAWARDTAARLPRIDVLVHNASEYRPTPTATVTVAEIERQMRVNAVAPLLMSRALFGALSMSRLAGGGSIVTLADIHAGNQDRASQEGGGGRGGEGASPRRGYIAYAMSKAALAEITRVLAKELAPRVRVNAVALGVVAFAEHEDEAFRSRYLARVPLGRAGTPSDAAGAVAWLALHATYCTGEVVRVDGGKGLGS